MNDETTGLRSFSGLIGQNLISCENLSEINFLLSECKTSEVDKQLLSINERYIFEVSQKFKSKNFQNDLLKHGLGTFSWLTWANSVLRLYVRVKNTSAASKEIVRLPNNLYRAIEKS